MVNWERKAELYRRLGYTPWQTAIPIHQSQAIKRYIDKGVRYGGTTIGAMEIVAGMCEPRVSSEYWVVAPSYDLTMKLIVGLGPEDWSVGRCFNSPLLKSLTIKPLTESSGNIALTVANFEGGQSLLRGMSADNPESLEARAINGCVIDECSAIKETIVTQHIIPRLIERNGWLLCVSRPRRRNWFYTAWTAAFAVGAAWKLPTLSRPWLPEIRMRIEEEMALCTKDVCRELYDADFLPGGGSVFRYVDECLGGSLGRPDKGRTYSAGLDLARWQDFTWLIVLDKRTGQVQYSERWQLEPWSTIEKRVAKTVRLYDADLYVDSSGIGDRVAESLEDMHLRVIPIQTGVEKKEIIETLILAMESTPRKIFIPTECLDLITELKNYEYTALPSGRLRMSAPPGQHDDGVIALALASMGLQVSTLAYGFVGGRQYPATMPMPSRLSEEDERVPL